MLATVPTEVPKIDLMSTALQMLQSKSLEPTSPKTQNSMEGLSDSDLKTLLQNFKDLSTDEQHGLITYLKKLEAREPERVERLRKFVKLGPNSEPEKPNTGRMSPFSNREGGTNPCVEELDKNNPPQKKISIDSEDDEEYTFEDVFRAASKNVSDKQAQDDIKKDEKLKDLNINFNDTKAIIANLMGQLGNASKNNPALSLLGLTSSAPSTVTQNTITTAQNLVQNPKVPDVAELIKNIPQNLLNMKMPVNKPIENQNMPYPVNTITPNPQASNQNYGNYNYPQRNYGYDNFEQSFQGQNPQSYNQMGDYNYDYNYQNQGMGQGPRAPFNRQGQYPPYNARQNYY